MDKTNDHELHFEESAFKKCSFCDEKKGKYIKVKAYYIPWTSLSKKVNGMEKTFSTTYDTSDVRNVDYHICEDCVRKEMSFLGLFSNKNLDFKKDAEKIKKKLHSKVITQLYQDLKNSKWLLKYPEQRKYAYNCKTWTDFKKEN